MAITAGVIGIGAMGRHYVRLLANMKGVKLIGAVDIDPATARIAHENGIDFFSERDALLGKHPDLVCVAVPTTSHYEVTMDALSAGCHVLVEKPITNDIPKAIELAHHANEKSLKLFVGHVERFNPVVRRLKELISEERFGEIQSIASLRVGRFRQTGRDTGIILDLGTHDIDVISYLYGMRAESVFAVADCRRHDAEDLASITLKFSSTKSGYIELSWLTPYKVRKMFVTGNQRFGLVDLIDQSLIIYEGKEWAKVCEVEKDEPLRLELESVVRCVVEDLRPEVGGEEGIYALKVAQAAVISAREGRGVNISEIPGDLNLDTP